ncbi:TetR/AcrR family transcriptional regulator [Nocardia sp. NPDC046763]|uniref:TetR family transcriptional regulator C-terminal domain-containing protein n=1 Tax=Nocardia sp. NPDC046763 TaxID=3155256 RepID=UPI0033E8BE3B
MASWRSATQEISDQRRLEGARARATIARHAADVASVEGLTGLSLGRLAGDLGVSKSGVATLFGGCFRCASVPEFDSRPGPVRDALAADRDDWFAVLEKEIGRAQEQGYLAGLDPHIVAFQPDAVVAAANTAARMGDDTALPTARAIVEGLLGSTLER